MRVFGGWYRQKRDNGVVEEVLGVVGAPEKVT
jgi:hypothetical protein